MRILYFVPAAPELRALIQAEAPDDVDLQFLDNEEEAEWRAKFADAEIVIVGAKPLRAEHVAAAPKLRLVLHQGVGYHDTTPTADLRDRQIGLAITPGGTPEGVAEHTIMMMLAVGRRLARVDAELREGRWHSNTYRAEARGLAGAKVGIVGLGRIGRQVARRLAPFGCTVAYTDIVDIDPAVERELQVRRTGLEALLAESDFLTLHVPLTDLTRHMIDAAAIAAMPDGAILINCARGPVVEEAALLDALRSGKLGGAGLDVFEVEPIPGPSPFAAFHNVVLTPHHAPGTREVMQRKFREVFENAERYRRGDSLENRVVL